MTTLLISASLVLGQAKGFPLETPTKQQKAVMVSLVAIPENSQTTPAYTYAENIKDGRGITVGMIGFTTGTFDGNRWLHHYTKLNPKNRLAKYIPALDRVDRLPHPNGLCNDTAGLDGFIADFGKSGSDPHFRQSQLDMMDELYYKPTLAKAKQLGARLPITLAQLFDTAINFGTDGLDDLLKKVGPLGTPTSKDGEAKWLVKYLDARKAILLADPTWREAADRVEMYRRLVQAKNFDLKPPFKVTCYGQMFTVTGEGVLP
jgi:chitosanase